MLTPNQTLDMRPIGAVFRIIKTPEQTNGQSLEMEWELLDKADGTPVHIHPSADETYKVLEGQLDICINGRWKTLKAGEELTVIKGAPHTFRNAINGITRVYNIHSPALHFDNYFEALNNVVAKLSSGGKEKLTMNLNSIIHLSVLMKKYKEEVVSVNPPNFVVSIMNVIGKLRGIKV